MKKRIIIKVAGKVQKIGFRYAAMQKANELGVKGYAKNNPDGSVILEAEGVPGAVTEFADWCSSGPPWAAVEHFFIEEAAPAGYESFTIQ